MEGVSQVLQFAVIIERSWPFSFDSQTAQEFDFMRRGIAGQRRVLKKFPEPGFFVRLIGLSLYIREFPGISRRESPAQRNLHSEGCQVDIPGLNERLQKRDTVLIRQVEYICVQKLKNVDSRLLVCPAAESRHQAEPVFTCQFLFGDALHDVQEFLRDQPFQFTEGLRFKDGADFLLFLRPAFAENQLASFLEQGSRRVSQTLL